MSRLWSYEQRELVRAVAAGQDRVYRLKNKLVKAILNITIKEV